MLECILMCVCSRTHTHRRSVSDIAHWLLSIWCLGEFSNDPKKSNLVRTVDTPIYDYLVLHANLIAAASLIMLLGDEVYIFMVTRKSHYQ